MKQTIIILLSALISFKVFGDIAPSPINVKGIYTVDSCKIRMVSEIVYADLYRDSARVECTFELLNYGDSTTIEIGFPEMNFKYWSMGSYSLDDKRNFRIYVDNIVLTEEQIGVPQELDSIYNTFMYIYFIEEEYNRKVDSIYKANNIIIKDNGTYVYQSKYSWNNARLAIDSLYKWRLSKPSLGSDLFNKLDIERGKGNYPWYVWKVHFKQNERKTIKVIYELPSGKGYGADYRYFNYLLSTGSGWYSNIEKADVILNLHGIISENIEEISPINFVPDSIKNIITWKFENVEPTVKEDIYVRYYDSKERKAYKRYQEKRKRAKCFRMFNPINWFR